MVTNFPYLVRGLPVHQTLVISDIGLRIPNQPVIREFFILKKKAM